MTYLRFHLLFNLPPLALLLALDWGSDWTRGESLAAGLVLLAVMAFTTPWDNLAAKWGIWGFPPGKYLVKVGYLPVEEYAFFLLQSVNVMLAVVALLHRVPDWQTGEDAPLTTWTLIWLGASIVPWLFVLVQLRWLRRKVGPCVNYANHLAWFLPVIYAQWIIAPWLLWHHVALLAVITAGFGIYYTVADLVAVHGGTWFFDEAQITGWKLGGLLPWEEIAFFLLTSLLVAQSFLLLMPSEAR